MATGQKRNTKRKEKTNGHGTIVSSAGSDKSIFPDDLFYQILLRSSVKSLLSFRWVCTPWLNAISEPQFIQKHLLLSTRLDRQKILVRGSTHCFLCSLDYRRNGTPFFEVERAQSFLMNQDWVSPSKVIGSYNGVVVLGFDVEQCFALWNPSTGIYNCYSPCTYPSSSNFNGICYDSEHEDYKAVFGTISSSRTDYMSLQIYSFRNNSYRILMNLPYFSGYTPTRGVTVNGVLHWEIRKRNDYDYFRFRHVIVYYDWDEHKVNELMLPPECCETGFDYDVQLANMKGCLCLCYYDTGNHKLVLWMMKEYHVVESWVQVISTKDVHVRNHWFNKYDPKPLFFTRYGDLVVATKKKGLIIYHPIKKTITRHKIKLPNVVETFEATVLDSLVVPNVR